MSKAVVSGDATGGEIANAVEVVGVNKIFNLGKAAQVDALVGVDLTVQPGEFVSLIGAANIAVGEVMGSKYNCGGGYGQQI